MAIVRPDEIYNELKKLINLPENATSVDIHMSVDGFVTVNCEYFANKGTGEKITKSFNLVPEEPDIVDVTTLESSFRKWRIRDE